MRRVAPEVAALEAPEPVDARTFAAALPAGTVLLSYSVADASAQVVTVRDGQVRAHDLGTSRGELAARVRRLRLLLGRPTGSASLLERRVDELSRTLLAPAAAELAGARAVMVCPDGALHFVPFAALRLADGRRLAEAAPVFRTVSATAWVALRDEGPEPRERVRLVALGDPAYPEDGSGEGVSGIWARLERLPATRTEVQRAAAAFPGLATVRLGGDATEGAVRELASGADLLHLAAHGVYHPVLPLSSGIALAPPPGPSRHDGVLQAWEVMESLRLEPGLVVLSACETGLGEDFGGEGVLGLVQAFHVAGARDVVASLWTVSDRATAELMGRMYAGLADGLPAAEALRRAQLHLLRSAGTGDGSPEPPADHTHPFFWSAFVLTGDGLSPVVLPPVTSSS
jgi:CHAT domain-containing protein